MCGLVCIITKRPSYGFSRDELDTFKTMLLVDSLRGEDSTGVFGVTNQGNVSIAKSAEHSGTFIASDAYKDIDRKMFSKGFAFVGHNRKATRGQINDQNAHPFWVEDEVVLVHNGTFYGDHKHLADTDVDSHALAHTIQKHEPDDVAEAFTKINAAYATIWYDVRDKSVNVLRNGHRPLYFLNLPTCWILCSEKEMIEFAVKRAKLNVPENAGYALLKEHVLMKLINDNGTVTPKTIEVEGYKHKPVTVSHPIVHTPARTTNLVPYNRAANNAIACAWNDWENDLDEGTVIDQLVMKKEVPDLKLVPNKKEVTVTEITDKVIYDMPISTYDMMKHSDWTSLREVYQPKADCYFRARHIVQIRDDLFAVYGPLTVNDSLIGIALIKEDDFSKIIHTEAKNFQELHGKVESIYYRNVVEEGTQRDDWSGYGFVNVSDINKVEESYASC